MSYEDLRVHRPCARCRIPITIAVIPSFHDGLYATNSDLSEPHYLLHEGSTAGTLGLVFCERCYRAFQAWVRRGAEDAS